MEERNLISFAKVMGCSVGNWPIRIWGCHLVVLQKRLIFEIQWWKGSLKSWLVGSAPIYLLEG